MPVGDTIRDGSPIPVCCPLCGRKTIRQGNRHERRVYCSGALETIGRDEYGLISACDWHSPVYHADTTVPAS
jgi:transposase